ncbi:MAG: DDE-type integrase/transposase/recombinase [Cyanobacteria bacterium J06642_2]
MLARQFETPEPDRAWAADMTYVWTSEDWLYLAVIIDQFSRRVVGWSMAEHMRTILCESQTWRSVRQCSSDANFGQNAATEVLLSPSGLG